MAPKMILNEYKFCKDYVIGYCTNGKEFIFDIDDYDRVKQYTWRAQNSTVYTNITRCNTISLGRFILNKDHGDFKVLFKNKDSFDCRKTNLFCGNEYVDKGDYYQVFCFDGRYFSIDKDDYEGVKQYVWHIDKGGYVITKIKSKVIKLHRFVLGIHLTPEPEVDHIDRDKCNNRRSNLRFSDRSGNCINKNLLPSNKSGKTGVYWNKSIEKWMAQINKDGERYYLGCFDRKEDAVEARISAEIKYHKEFAPSL